MNNIKYQTYIQILKEELVPAMGCTEPIALSYCASKAHDILNKMPERCLVEVSGNIIKNVKSVVVPNTNGLKGIEAAVAAGIVAGNTNKLLEVIAEFNDKIVLNYDELNVADIYEFACLVKIDDIKEVIKRQIDYNSKIANEGIINNYGANIGSVLLKSGNDTATKAKAMAAAGSDARMSGCELPVVINSGSGNQGITITLPIVEYAKALNVSDEKLYRALVLANLIAIHQKNGIGRLSAYCGAVSAGCAAGSGIAFLHGGDYQCIAHTLVNSLAITSGIICDGAKSSCAAKIAASVDAGILGYKMYLEGQEFKDGDGIVVKGVENTIRNVARLGKIGMKETDKEIIKIMMDC